MTAAPSWRGGRLAEFVGTAFLVAAVIGSGIAAARLSPHDVGLQLLENSIITGAALVALILALQPVSAAFNPVVTLVERALGAISSRDAAGLIVAQIAGGFVGAVVANLMFSLSAVNLSTHHRGSGGTGSARSSPPWACWSSSSAPSEPDARSGRVRRRRLHPGRVLVHQLDQLRQPRRDDRADALQHLRRHRPGVGR